MSVRDQMEDLLEAKKKKRLLTKREDSIMADAVAKRGAAAYLFKRELAALERDGHGHTRSSPRRAAARSSGS